MGFLLQNDGNIVNYWLRVQNNGSLTPIVIKATAYTYVHAHIYFSKPIYNHINFMKMLLYLYNKTNIGPRLHTSMYIHTCVRIYTQIYLHDIWPVN